MHGAVLNKMRAYQLRSQEPPGYTRDDMGLACMSSADSTVQSEARAHL